MRDWLLPEVRLTRRSSGAWELLEPWEAQLEAPRFGRLQLTIPAGFRFDLASVPRLFWRILAPFELGLRAPLVHDWLYRHGGRLLTGDRITRKEADTVFRLLVRWEDDRRLAGMRAAEAHIRVLGRETGHRRLWRLVSMRLHRCFLVVWLPARRWLVYYAVRIGGWRAWVLLP